MIILSGKQFSKTPTSDTVCIMGSGWSINTINKNEWDFIRSHDSFAYNWFCLGKTPITPTYYMVHVQGCDAADKDTEYTPYTFIDKLRCSYVVLLKARRSSKPPKPFYFSEHLEIIQKGGVVFEYGNADTMSLLGSPFDKAYNPPPALGFVMHIALWLGYKNIVLFGVDLYDSRYYWHGYDETWGLMKTHLDADNTTRFMHADETISMFYGITSLFPNRNIQVHNPKSLLTEMLPVWKL